MDVRVEDAHQPCLLELFATVSRLSSARASARHPAVGGGALLREGAEHGGELRVGALVEAVDGAERDAHEDALDDALAPGRGVEMRRVRAERRGDQPGVVGAQRVVQQRHQLGADLQQRQRGEHGQPLGGVALLVQVGGPGRVGHLHQQQRPPGPPGGPTAVREQRLPAELALGPGEQGRQLVRVVADPGQRVVEPVPFRYAGKRGAQLLDH
nr:hypothetical protein GCM10020092_058780 [Actinoplanes digitatis]